MGFGGNKHCDIMQGTIVWKIPDDKGNIDTFHIRNSYWAPKGGIRLLSPQHWAKEYRFHTNKNAHETTNDKEITLYWNNGKNKRNARLTEGSNIGNITTMEGYSTYKEKMNVLSIQIENNKQMSEQEMMNELSTITENTSLFTLPNYKSIQKQPIKRKKLHGISQQTWPYASKHAQTMVKEQQNHES